MTNPFSFEAEPFQVSFESPAGTAWLDAAGFGLPELEALKLPKFGARMTLDQASKEAKGKGIYQIYLGTKLIYVGESQNLGRRIQQHLWCLKHMAVATDKYAVRFGSLPDLDTKGRRSVEKQLIEKNRSRGITNREDEEELWEESWN
jgi:hypothetical protein